jgi:hypothetical protein
MAVMMFDDTGDEPLDPTLLEAARDYNAPPSAVPREAMWSAIQATRAKVAAESGVRSIQSAPRPASHTPPHRTWRRAWPVAIAASLVLAAGIAIGRWTGAPPARTIVAVAPQPGRRVPATLRGDRAAYQVAVAHDLTQAEALLTAYRSEDRSSGGQAGSADVAGWARDVLSNTRLLLDSPAGADPKQRRLLEDLELVLVQMVEVSPDSSGAERQMIDSTLEHGHVLSRIRYAVPAGATGI